MSYAGFWKRFVAYCIDVIILGVATFVIFVPILALIGIGAASSMESMEYMDEDQLSDEGAAMMIALFGAYMFTVVVAFVAGWLYFALMESSAKQGTLGKMALSIVVTDLNGNRLTFGRATGRYFGKILSGAIFYIGFIMAGFTEKKQALHDMIAGCLVVNK
ncbi:MAG: RDD family protein [Bacteroidota bacterium]